MTDLRYVRLAAGLPPDPPPGLKVAKSITLIDRGDGTAFTDQELIDRANAAAARGYQEVGAPSAPRGEPLAIVCGGPTLEHTAWLLTNWPGEIWACNRTGAWLLDRGIRPTGIVMIDAVFGPEWLDPRFKDVPHYLASMMAPSLFDAADAGGFDVVLWHSWRGQTENPERRWWIGNGPTVGARAPFLALHLGYRDLHLFGLDGDFTAGPEHVYDNPTNVRGDGSMIVDCNGRRFTTIMPFARQCVTLRRLAKAMDGAARFTVYGDSLLSAVMGPKDEPKFQAVLTPEQARLHGPAILYAAKIEAREDSLI